MKRRVGYSCGHVVQEEIPEDEVRSIEILLGRTVDRDSNYAGFPVVDTPCGTCVFEERNGPGTAE